MFSSSQTEETRLRNATAQYTFVYEHFCSRFGPSVQKGMDRPSLDTEFMEGKMSPKLLFDYALQM